MFASTYNGQYEDVARIDAVLEQIWRVSHPAAWTMRASPVHA